MQKLCCVCTRQQFSASLDYFVTSSPPYLHQFSTISGGNCIKNACIRYDSNLKSRPSPASRAAYQRELSHDQHDNPSLQDYYSSGTTYGGIDMPAEEFYQVHTTNLNRPPNVSTITPRKSSPPPGSPTPKRSPGPIFLPANIYKLLSDVAIKELKKHNATTRSNPPPQKGC